MLVIVVVVERKGEGNHGVLGAKKKSYIIRGLEQISDSPNSPPPPQPISYERSLKVMWFDLPRHFLPSFDHML